MPTTQQQLQTATEVGAILALLLASTDERRTVFESLDAADQAVACAQATADFARVRWEGTPFDAEQATPFPRVDRTGTTILPGGEMDLPAGVNEWSVAGVPAEIRRGHALQTARRAVEARGFSRARQTRDEAHAGITGRSGGGVSVTFDGDRMRSPLAALDPDARAFVDRFVLRTAGLA